MSDPGETNHWESLAKEMGIPDAEKPSEPRAVPTKPPPQKPRRRSSPPAAERSETDWQNVAGELGLSPEVDAVPAEKTPDPPAFRAEEPLVADAPVKAVVSPDAFQVEDDGPPTAELLASDAELAETRRPVEDVERHVDFGDGESDSSEEGTKSSRRRRRPRRRSGRRKTSEDDNSTSSPAEAETETAEADDDELPTMDDDESESEDRPSRPGHRNIPTWDEAIRVITDTNLASRSKSHRPGSSRGRGRGRGRKR